MKRLLIITGWGLVLWSLSLLWPTSSLILTPATTFWIIGGLGLIIMAYLTGQYVAQTERPREDDFQTSVHTRQTRPTPVVYGRGHFSRQTAPMPIMARQNPASRPTQPFPLAR
ncbi:MAG: hypothetical protein Fur0044_38150 [Anaerolineae bacterium]|nr:hypothetical protein [Anaerolineales bacterium]MCQ3978761.1 hypothetical protein [Anaerolineae bacterium]